MVYFGGLDLAKRYDFSAFVLLEHENGILIQKGQKVWPHVNYRIVANGVYKINERYRMRKICFDRQGVGDAAQELFSRELPLEEVVSSLQIKIEIINFLNSLWHNKKLVIADEQLYQQVLQQEKHTSDAGNILYRHPSGTHDDLFWALGYACFAAKGLLMGTPKPTMARMDRQLNMGRNPVDEDIMRTLGEGWNMYG